MKKEQLYKILKVSFFACLLMLFFEILFSDYFPVTDTISGWIQSIEDKTLLWIAIWFFMFIQICLIPIPSVIVLNTAMYAKVINPGEGFSGLINMFKEFNTWKFISIVIFAYMCGILVTYFLGLKLGKKALCYCAGTEEEYRKWSKVLNEKGKIFYALTVLLPVFPDDILCLVAGSVKLDLPFFVISNLICRTIGLVSAIGTLAFIQSVNSATSIPISIIMWAALTICCFVYMKILKHEIDKVKI